MTKIDWQTRERICTDCQINRSICLESTINGQESDLSGFWWLNIQKFVVDNLQISTRHENRIRISSEGKIQVYICAGGESEVRALHLFVSAVNTQSLAAGSWIPRKSARRNLCPGPQSVTKRPTVQINQNDVVGPHSLQPGGAGCSNLSPWKTDGSSWSELNVAVWLREPGQLQR